MSEHAITDPAKLKERLEEVLDVQSDHERYSIGADYCLLCDEYVLGEKLESGEYRRLDCQHDHYEHIITQDVENPTISAWVDCLEWLGVE